jgi:primosomal protein N' (replication factor Y)
MPLYCDVALPVPLRRTFVYSIPEVLRDGVQAGCRVVAPFGRRTQVGVVLEVHGRAPDTDKLRNIGEVLDPIPAISPKLLELARWVAGYYVAPIGEVVRAMLPPLVEVRRQLEMSITDSGRAELAELLAGQDPDSVVLAPRLPPGGLQAPGVSPRGRSLGARSRPELAAPRGREAFSAEQAVDFTVLSALEKAGGAVREERLHRLAPAAEAAVLRLIRRGAIESRSVARHRKARMQRIVAWAGQACGTPGSATQSAAEARLHEVLTAERGPLPLHLLLKLAEVSPSVVQRLERAGRVQSWEEPLAVDEELFETDFTPPLNVLNPAQERALGAVHGWLEAGEFRTGLLFGVTGSGKTEIYLGAIERALAAGRTALMLVPEIALTLWTSRLCRARFGDVVAVLHSALPDSERAREWWRVRRGAARVVVGTRSAVFAPLESPALIIVDEEQESAYKQEETPRYHARDVAIVRARLEGAVALLGSATPSLESFHNAQSGKYELLQLEGRVENRPLAPVSVVDMREDFQRTRRAAPLSELLRGGIAARLEAQTQALVLMNRRGFSWFVLCRSCGAAVQCENCSISLTYYKRRQRLACHYCGYSRAVPAACPKCASPHIYFVGEGTEQIEELLRKHFPAARIGRLDRDAVRTKRAYQQVLGAFASGALDVLVGTQMVAKGHDFQRVTLVGVVNADLLLGMPDFRSAERTFQLLTQVAGRAGRGTLPGEVLVQTYYPEHYAIQHAARQDYVSFYEKEAHFRRMLSYPPFTALASVIVRDGKLENAIRWSRALGGFLTARAQQGLRVLGPAPAPLARLRTEHRFQFLLKSPQRTQLSRVLTAALDFCLQKQVPENAVLVDVDPLSLL